MSYQPKVYRKQGGDELVVASGGKINIETGGTVEYNGDDLIAEIAALSGLDSTELGLLNGATVGSITASKVVTRDAAKAVPLEAATLAAAGNSQGTAAAIVAQVSIVTGADNTTAVRLPVAAAGQAYVVVNTVANKVLPVYPATGAQINGGGADAAFTLGPGQAAVFHCTAALTWYVKGQAAATPTVTELAAVAGVTLGTNAAGKAVTAGSDGYVGAATFDGAVTLGVNGVGGVAGSLVIKDGANPGASSSIAYADLAQIQGITPGTSAASKAVVLGADSKINALDITSLTLNGTAMTATAAQLNALATTQGGLAAILAAGLGGSHSVIKTETETHTVVAAHATKDRAVLVVATVDEAFATGDTSRTIITVGEADTPDKMWAAAKFPDGTAAGTVFVGAFTNTATKAITITSTAAAGTGTGGVTVAVIAIPTT